MIQNNGRGAEPNGKTRGVSPAFPRMRQTPPSSVRKCTSSCSGAPSVA